MCIQWGLPDQRHRWPYHPDEGMVMMCLTTLDPVQGKICPNFTYGSFFLYLLGVVIQCAAWVKMVILTPSVEFYRTHILELRKIYLAGRLLSLFWGMLSIYLTYYLGRMIFNKRVGILAACVVAIAPLAVIQSSLMTPHAQCTALLLAAIICGVQIIRRGTLKWYIFCAISTALASTTYWFFGTTTALVLVAAHIFAVRQGRLSRNNWLQRNKKLLYAACMFGVVFTVTAPCVVFGIKDFIFFWRMTQAKFNYPSTNIIYPLVRVLPYGFGSSWLVAALGGSWMIVRGKSKEAKIFLFWAILYYVMAVFTGSHQWVRRFTPLVPAGAIFGAYCLIMLGERIKRGRGLLIIITISLLLQTAWLSGASLSLYSHDTRDAAYVWINEKIPAQSRIAVVNWFHIPHIDKREYQITEAVSVEDFKKGPFDYYLASSFDIAMERVFADPTLFVVKKFSHKPEFLAITFDDRSAPRDLRYANPDIYLFSKNAG